MPNIKHLIHSTKTSWVRRLLTQSEIPWVNLFTSPICTTEKFTKFGTAILSQIYKKVNNPFWKDVLSSYEVLTNNVYVKNNINILDSPLWYNQDIFPYNTHFKTWWLVGINYVKDVINENGKMLTFTQIKTKYNKYNLQQFD